MIEKNDLLNSDVEVSLRILMLVDSDFGQESMDIDEILYLDYLVIHMNDFDSSLVSIHPSMPNKEQEVLVRRASIQKAILLLISRDLIAVKYTDDGIKYASNSFTNIFTNYFESEYAKEIKESVQVLIRQPKEKLITTAKKMLVDGVRLRKSKLDEDINKGENNEWI